MTGIVVLGGIQMDLVALVTRAPGTGETVTGRELLTLPGGRGTDQAVAASRAGGDVAVIGAVGTDRFGTTLRHTLDSCGVDTDLLRTMEGPSGTAHLVVDDDGVRTGVLLPGANATVTSLDPGDEALIASAHTLLLSLGTPLSAVLDGALVARRHGVRTVLTPSPNGPPPPELLAATDLLVPTAAEARALTGADDTETAARALLDRVPEVVVVLGTAGCLYRARGTGPLTVPAPGGPAGDRTATAVEPRGPDDAFAGALAVALGEGTPLPRALRFATAAAALRARRPGAATAMPFRPEIESAS
ncbi:PfkB family carbohydrate kinase [Streptomyces sp. NPDC000594]|uniref:PfkB family carbohydrate kinase n=1 Tax=Streptomyces sp. NPDC000594 TaxID=3154261 RepID=UPI003328E698